MSWSSTTGFGMGFVSLLSILGSASVNISFLIFPEFLKKQAYEIVNYFAFSTLMTSVGSVVGLPADGTPACWFEGIVTNIFTLSSIAWNHIIVYNLYCIIIDREFKLSYRTHFICWCMPTIL